MSTCSLDSLVITKFLGKKCRERQLKQERLLRLIQYILSHDFFIYAFVFVACISQK